MPLFMDIHIIENEAFSEIAAHQEHLKDLEVQNQFKVVNHKYFLNLAERKIFCLMEAPTKKACLDSHISAHGIGPCNIIEISHEFDFMSFMGQGDKNEKDLATIPSGELDTGYRTLMMLNLVDFTGAHSELIARTLQCIEKHDGNHIKQPDTTSMASFVHASDALTCALAMSRILKNIHPHLDFTIALVTGWPVDEEGPDFFGEARQQLRLLCSLGGSDHIYVDMGTKALINNDPSFLAIEESALKFIQPNDFLFFEKLEEVFANQSTKAEFRSDQLNRKLGLSKAQAYRKIKALTGMSPNEMIREIRLRRSLQLLSQNGNTVAEIAYTIGFNSPTYFTRVFRKRYGVLPTTFAKL